MFGLKDELHFARVTVRKFALAGMLRQHVAAFDIDCLANAIWHFGQQIDLPRPGKRNLATSNVPMIHGRNPVPGIIFKERASVVQVPVDLTAKTVSLFLLTSQQFLCQMKGSAIHVMISLSVPIYNEEGSIEELFEKVRVVMNRNGDPWEIIFVNDGSLDRSEEILNRLATAHREVKVIHFRRNFGQTAAMMAGFDFASGDIIVPMDGDGQNDPEDIPRMLAKLREGYDVCSGWRRDRRDNAIQRNIPSIMANKLISAVSGVRLHDFGCSLKAYRAEVLEGIRLYGEMHRFLPIYAKWHGARITEIPVNHFARSCGSSKYGLERVLKVLMDLVTVKFMDRFMLKPMYLFGLWGVAFFAAAFGFSVWTLYMRTKGYFFTGTPLPMMAVFSFMTGVICILMGLLAEMITRTFHESQNKSIYLVRETRNIKSFPKAA